MDEQHARELGSRLRARREELGLSSRALARATDMNDGTIVRLEQGQFAAPAPDKLARIADVLKLDLADVFALAGYAAPSQLPAWRPYLRAKYGQLPSAAVDELESFFDYLSTKYGASVDGPAAGEDEVSAEEWRAKEQQAAKPRQKRNMKH